MEVKFKKLHEDAVEPQKAHESDAGWDLTVCSVEYDHENNVWVYGSGLSVEIPAGYVGKLHARSSVFKTGQILSNCVGIIDSGYRGEVMAKFYHTFGSKEYAKGERFAQLLIEKVEPVEWVQVDELSTTDRGEGGYGSSGK